MKKIPLLLFFVFASLFVQAQIKNVSEVSVGSSGDFTIQPISTTSDFSKSQVIYYPDQVQFRGEINEIRYQTIFFSSSFQNSNKWIVKIGYTNIEEFGNGQGFIPNLTEVFNGDITVSGYDVIIPFTQPFQYDGLQNIVIEVEEVAEGETPNLTTGFVGEENFGNPPNRSIVSLTNVDSNGGSSTNFRIENSYAKTIFLGNLEQCIVPSLDNLNGAIHNITANTADVIFRSDVNISSYRYNVSLIDEDIPTSFDSSANPEFTLENLLPARQYFLNYKSDCDAIPTSYRRTLFATKPITISVPKTIDFEGNFGGDYYPSGRQRSSVNVVSGLGKNSSNGLLFKGSDTSNNTTYNENLDDLFRNSDFVSTADFIIDLSSNPSQPIFSFDLKQLAESNLRIKINNFPQEFVYKSLPGSTDEFRNISIDLTRFSGQTIELTIEHVSRYSGPSNLRSAVIDNIALIENTCSAEIDNISTTSTTNSIDVSWTSTATNFEVFYSEHNSFPSPNSIIALTTNNITLENLDVATSYDIYVRALCTNVTSNWKRIVSTTAPNVITIPFDDTLRSSNSDREELLAIVNTIGSFHAYAFEGLVLVQKDNDLFWTGDFDTTEEQAWNENKDFITGVHMRVDATQVSDLTMKFRLGHRYRISPNNSWFRILVNGNQIGNSYTNPPGTALFNQDIITDLSAYTGGIVDIVLQQSGRYSEYCQGCRFDGVELKNLSFESTTLSLEDTEKNTIEIFPNPADNFIQLSNADTIQNVGIYDLQGRLILNTVLDSANRIDLSKLSFGVYMLRLEGNNGAIQLKKLIKN